MTAYFCVENLAVQFGDTPVVNGLSFELEQGEIGCLLGFSGCGKTTALRTIAGLESCHHGKITLAGSLLTEADTGKHSTQILPAKRGIGMVFQDYALFTHLNVYDNIAFGLNHLDKATIKSKVDAMLALTELDKHAHKRIDELSGGQQQRVALARALAPSPQLLLLDEPFSNLDMLLREQLAMNIRDILKETNTTAILVTHDQHEAFAMADKIGVMHQGRLAQWASASELYHQPASPFIAEFIGEGAMIDGVVSDGHVQTALGRIYRKMDVMDASGQPQYCRYDYANGTKIKVLVRPDDIIHDDNSTMSALVVGRVFRGANYLYRLQLDDGQTVLSLIPSHHDHPIGGRIGIVPMLEHVVVFQADETDAEIWAKMGTG